MRLNIISRHENGTEDYYETLIKLRRTLEYACASGPGNKNDERRRLV
jgi:hypothetical protein